MLGWQNSASTIGSMIMTFACGFLAAAGWHYGYLIYLIGNLGFMLNLLLLKKMGKDKIRNSFFNSLIYLLSGYILMEGFRGIASILIAGSDAAIIRQFIFSDMLSLVFAILVIIVVRKQEGLFADQKEYLIEVNSKKDEIDGGWQDE